VEIAFDPAKDALNQQKHGLSLANAALMSFDKAYVVPDERRAYGETGYQAYGLLAGRLHVLAFTMRGDVLRAISPRKANRKEVQRHGQ
jgi:uncharacterized DUF497 family protein